MSKAKVPYHKKIFYNLDREKKWLEQGNKCFYCETPLDRNEATLDHIVPLSKGGGHCDSNIVAACLKCNCAKDDNISYEPSEFDLRISKAITNIEARTRKALWRIDLNPSTCRLSYNKWEKYWKKRGRFE